MSLLVDTSVWSLAFRREPASKHAAVVRLRDALAHDEELYTTGLVLQELLQGLKGPRQRTSLIARFDALPFIVPTREDHIAAATLRNKCRTRGVQLGTIDALLAQLCVDRELGLLTSDRDFAHAARHIPLTLAVPP
ncbi:MAG TPA: PIN domain-containing protein [Nannocystaceae bacterium]|nr:PIN domain-containing protein [Nannocystaceae bacterium]